MRPGIDQLAPRFAIERDGDDLEGAFGNPDLTPYRARNLDLGVEWYFARSSVLQAGVFYKDIQDYIVTVTFEDGDGPFNGVYRGLAFTEADIPLNTGDATIRGVEVAYSQAYSMLPAPFDGLLTNLNYTFTDADGQTFDGRNGGLRDIPLPASSRHTFNVVLGYEKGPVSIRFAGTYRDRYLAPGVLVAASDRGDPANAGIALFRLDTQAARLLPLGTIPAGPGEAYGLCLGRLDGQIFAFLVIKEGGIVQIALDLAGAQARGTAVRRMAVGSQAEGCVVDERTAMLYVGEEDRGIWRFAAAPGGSVAGTLFAGVDGRMLVADVEGLAVAPQGAREGYFVASSQGDSAYALYRLPDGAPAGRFRIVKGRVGGASETDGIAIAMGDFGTQYPGGLMVVQDGENQPFAQNFKLVAWDDIVQAVTEAN